MLSASIFHCKGIEATRTLPREQPAVRLAASSSCSIRASITARHPRGDRLQLFVGVVTMRRMRVNIGGVQRASGSPLALTRGMAGPVALPAGACTPRRRASRSTWPRPRTLAQELFMPTERGPHRDLAAASAGYLPRAGMVNKLAFFTISIVILSIYL